MSSNQNPTTQLDFYKVGHHKQYPVGTELVYSNFTARKASHPLYDNPDGVVFLGLQKFILDYLKNDWNNHFFSRDKHLAVGKYQQRIDTSLGPGSIQYSHLEELHDLGYLPLSIKALSEGSLVPFGVPMLTIVNTDPRFFWLTNYIETVMSSELWKVCTVASIAREYKKILTAGATKTSDALEFVPFQCHDFSMRGMSGRHDAATSGLGHLASFVGSDNIPAIDSAEEYYDIDPTQDLIGTSVPATEHSVMSAGGKDGELETYRRLMEDVYPAGLLSIVSDTWDFFNVIDTLAVELKDVIMARNGKVVFRPDSGDPVKILTGYFEDEYFEDSGRKFCAETRRQLSDLEILGAIRVLDKNFGHTINSKGYKDLESHVGLIYGESITIDRCRRIVDRMEKLGYASTNVVFGVGSYTYQHLTRDCFSFAVKATYCKIDGRGVEIYKDPITDDGAKKSAKGLLMVGQSKGGKYFLQDQVSPGEEARGCLQEVFRDGELLNRTNFKDIRERVLKTIDLE